MMEIIIAVVSFLFGSAVNFLFMTKKLNTLSNRISILNDSISLLTAKYNDIEQLKYSNYELEKRMSTVESEIKRVEQEIK